MPIREGYPDGAQTMDEVLAHYRELAAATDIPLNADFENGFADDPDERRRERARAASPPASRGCRSRTRRRTKPRRSTISTLALARVKAARAAIDKAGGDVVFTARTEGFIRGRPDIDETIRRLKAFADAGADCLYSPGIKTREHIEATVKAVGGKSINFLNSGAFGFTVSDLAGMGVRRISVGGSLARVAMHAFIKTATEIASEGKFDGFAGSDQQRRAEQVLRRMTARRATTSRSQRIRLPASRSARRSIRRRRRRPGR